MEYTPEDFFEQLDGDLRPVSNFFENPDYGFVVGVLIGYGVESAQWVPVRFNGNQTIITEMASEGLLTMGDGGYCMLSQQSIDLLAKSIGFPDNENIPLVVAPIDEVLMQYGFLPSEDPLFGKGDRYASFSNGESNLDMFVSVDDKTVSLEVGLNRITLYLGSMYHQNLPVEDIGKQLAQRMESELKHLWDDG
jgi:hypothetical protein